MVASQGGHLKTELGLVKAATYSVPAAALTSLAKDPDVAYISPDRPLKGMGTVSSITRSTITLTPLMLPTLGDLVWMARDWGRHY